jgi:hypothetical protein
MLIYNIPSHFRGDTWNGISSVTVNSNRAPLNLAGASIKMQLREYIDSPVVLEFSTTAGSIVIVDAAQGIFSIPSTIVDIPIGVYSFDIQITQSNGVVGTYISGTWEIIADIEGAVLTGSVPPITIIVTALNYDPAGAATIAQANAQTYSNSLSSSYDPAGAAAAAQANAQTYSNSLSSSYDLAGAAAAAQNNAEAYADSLAVNYDLAGAAATAQANAQTYSTSLSSSYDPAGAATIAQNNAKTYSNSLSSSYDPAGAATIAQNNAKTYSNSLSSSYDVAGAATIAQNNAQTYSNSLSSSYDLAGAATIAQNNAQTYSNSLSSSYDLAGAATIAQANAQTYSNSLSSSYDLAGAATIAQNNAEAAAVAANLSLQATDAQAVDSTDTTHWMSPHATSLAIAIDAPNKLSARVIYASRAGCALNSNIDTGGGTDDTAALQAILDLASSSPIEVVIDGVALVSSKLIIKGSTKIRGISGGGVFQAAGTNDHILTTAGVFNPSTIISSIIIEKLVLNGNGNNQAKWVGGYGYTSTGAVATTQSDWGWIFGVWLARYSQLVMRDVTIRNAKTFALTLMQAGDAHLTNIKTLWDDGGTGFIGQNRDGIHLWGDLNKVHAKGFSSNGDDDTIALNTSENVGWTNAAWSRGSSGGYLGDILFEDVEFLNASNGIRTYYDGYLPGAKIGRFVLRNARGNILTVPMQAGLDSSQVGYFEIDGWDVGGAQNSILVNANEVRLNSIAKGVSVSGYAALVSGDYFSEPSNGWLGVGTPQNYPQVSDAGIIDGTFPTTAPAAITAVSISTLVQQTFPPTIGATSTTAVAGNDPRLTDDRTPTVHATTHSTGGSDPITPSSIGADVAGAATIAQNNAKTYSNSLSSSYDVAGAATIAQNNAKTYSNSLSSSYDVAGAATIAQNNAKTYSNSLSSSYDLAGAAATAQANAKTYSNSLSSSYDVAGAATIAQNNAKTYSNSLSSSYDVAGAATIAQNNAIAAIPPQVESANFSAVAGGRYITTATLTITDPTGVTNQSFVVIVASGTCTIGGVAYSSSNFPIIRYYNGTAWVTLPQTLTGVLTTSGFATTSPSIEIVSSHSIACAATLALSGILANDIVLTGSAVAITSITGGTLGGLYSLNNQTGGSVTLTNSASLICQTGANISLAVGASVFIRPASSTVVSTL